MKLFGYTDEGLQVEGVQPSQLAEVTLAATPDELRRIAKFLESAAHSMEQMGDAYDHAHLADHDRGFGQPPGFVVFKGRRS
jgi:hypothetical protein